jgi:hypothetical protein
MLERATRRSSSIFVRQILLSTGKLFGPVRNVWTPGISILVTRKNMAMEVCRNNLKFVVMHFKITKFLDTFLKIHGTRVVISALNTSKQEVISKGKSQVRCERNRRALPGGRTTEVLL